jgi:hypothetical protein
MPSSTQMVPLSEPTHSLLLFGSASMHRAAAGGVVRHKNIHTHAMMRVSTKAMEAT